MRRPVLLILLHCLLGVTVLCVFTSCTRQPEAEVNAIRFGMASPVRDLDPRTVTDAASSRIARLLYRALIDFDESATPVPSLATWQQLSPTHYRFSLGKKGRQFHNGMRLTATDVKATYDWVLNPVNGSPHRISIENIAQIDVLDDDHLDIRIKQPDPSFVGYLVLGIVPAKLIEAGHAFKTQPVGSGPFRFKQWPNKDLLILQRVRDQRQFDFLYVNNATTRVLKLLNREIDLLQNNLPTQLIDYLGRYQQIRIVRRAGINFSYLGFNLQDKDLKKLKVRRAIAHAINRRLIVEKMFGPKTRLANGIFVPEHWAGHPNLHSLAYDPTKARQLLREAGYSRDKPLVLLYNTSNDPFRVTLATIIQYQLGQVGIKVDLRTYDFPTVYNDIKKGNFQLFSLTWVAVKSPDLFRYVYHSASIPSAKNKGRGANRFRLRDAAIDRYIEAAENSTDRAQRIQYYRKIHERLIELMPVVPLWFEEQMAAMQQSITGYRLSNEGNFDSLEQVEKPLQVPR